MDKKTIIDLISKAKEKRKEMDENYSSLRSPFSEQNKKDMDYVIEYLKKELDIVVMQLLAIYGLPKPKKENG